MADGGRDKMRLESSCEDGTESRVQVVVGCKRVKQMGSGYVLNEVAGELFTKFGGEGLLAEVDG